MIPEISSFPMKRGILSFLVVEPNHGRRGAISDLLTGLGIESDSVADEGHAFQLLERKNYHAILADGLLPGFFFLQLAAARHTMNREVPMPVVAAVVEKDQQMQSLWGEENDFDERLEWPLCPAQLRQFMTNCEQHYRTL